MRFLPLVLLACTGSTSPVATPTPPPTHSGHTAHTGDSSYALWESETGELRMRPRLVGPDTELSCVDSKGASVWARWFRDGVELPRARALAGPHPVGSHVQCRVGPSSAETWVSTGAFGGNILFVLLDDVGIDNVDAYGHGSQAPLTPTMDGLADQGVLFRYAYVNPTCSPTRATILTGLHAMRHGIGRALSAGDGPMPYETWSLAEALNEADYGTAAIGKWHLGNGMLGPQHHGFSHYALSTGNLGYGLSRNYTDWYRIEDGVGQHTTTYATTDSVDSTLAFVQRTTGPWFVWLALHSAHSPFHVPPAGLHPYTGLGPNDTVPDRYDAMVSAADTELGRLLTELGDARDDTTIIVMGDNGTPPFAVRPPLDGNRAKSTPFEGGIHVPLIVQGPMVADPGRRSDALVSAVDMFPTVLELAGVEMPDPLADALDGVSILPALSAADGPTRPWIYTEAYAPVYRPISDRTHWDRIVRDPEWKLIRRLDGREILSRQGQEYVDVMPEAQPYTGDALKAAQRLRAVLDEALPPVDPGVSLTEDRARMWMESQP